MKIIIPKKLRKGDTIAFVSPSAGLAPFAIHRIKKAKIFLEQEGFKVIYAKHSLKNQGYVSASAIERANDINEVFADPQIKCVICTIGGNHSNQILKYIDWKLIRKNPKIFVGYSDISVLHYAFYKQAGLQTYYGPCAMTQFGEYPKIFDYTWDYFKKCLCQDDNVIEVRSSTFWTDEILDWFKKDDLKRPRKINKNKGYVWIREGKAQGKALGGCIPSINHLLGTKYWIDPSDSIFFIDIPEGKDIQQGLSLSEIDSYLADMDNAKVFDSIAGLIIGRPYHYSDEDFNKLINIVTSYCINKKCPILAQANIGHVDPVITLPYGAQTILDSKKDYFGFYNKG